MKKGSIKGMDGSELEAYFLTKPEPLDLNNLNELDVNENSAGCGTHEEAMKKKCCGGGCHSDKEAGKVFEFPTTLSWDAPKEVIQDFVAKVKDANKEESKELPYDSPLSNAFDYGYNVDIDPISKLFKMTSKFSSQNKVKIDDTIESDLLETGDLKLGRLYRVAGMNLVARFVAQIMIPEQKTLLQIKHHGIVLYVEERQLKKATAREVEEYVYQF